MSPMSLIQSMETSSVVAALTTLVLFVYAWWWAVNWKHHDDDDDVYTAFFDPKVNPVATPHAFVKILERMPKGSRILDLGVGSGVYLEHEPVHRVLRERKLFVDGVDISAPNVAICQERIKVQGLQAHFSAVCQDARTLDAEGKYDAILFMESFPVMSKSLFLDIFKSVQRFLKPGTGVNYLYHNLGDPKQVGVLATVLGKIAKPSVKLLIGIDFGRLTMRAEMDDLVRQGAPHATGADYQDEILLSADCSELNIDVSGVRNHFFRMWCHVIILAMKLANTKMEQHLITIRPKGGASPGRTAAKRRARSPANASR